MKPNIAQKPSGVTYVAATVTVLAPLALLGFLVAGIAASFYNSEVADRLIVPLAATFAGSSLAAVVLGYLVRSRARSTSNQADAEIARIALAVGGICAFWALIAGMSMI